MSALDKVRSFAETVRCEDVELIRDGLTYGDANRALLWAFVKRHGHDVAWDDPDEP